MLRTSFAAAIIAMTLSACSFSTEFEHDDKASMSCSQLKTALAKGKALQSKLKREGASPLALLRDGEKPNFIERVSTRLMIWGSGGQEAAEKKTDKSFAAELAMLSSEIRRRCN